MENLSNETDNRSRIRKPIPKKDYSWKPKSLITKMKEIVGEPKYKDLNQFSDSQVIEFLKLVRNLSDYIPCNDEEEKQTINEMFRSILVLAQLDRRNHNHVLEQFRGRFNEQELECIFNAYDSLLILNDSKGQTSLKDALYEFLSTADNVFLNTKDKENFKSEIGKINSIVFDVFIVWILTQSKVKEKEDLISYLKKVE